MAALCERIGEAGRDFFGCLQPEEVAGAGYTLSRLRSAARARKGEA